MQDKLFITQRVASFTQYASSKGYIFYGQERHSLYFPDVSFFSSSSSYAPFLPSIHDHFETVCFIAGLSFSLHVPLDCSSWFAIWTVLLHFCCIPFGFYCFERATARLFRVTIPFTVAISLAIYFSLACMLVYFAFLPLGLASRPNIYVTPSGTFSYRLLVRHFYSTVYW